MDDLYRGQRIGKYEILTQLTLGGMAELFLAFTAGPGGFRKYVVVKRILPDVKADDQFVTMFLDEARLTAALSHPNIAQVFDLGEEEDGLYLAMEFISGQNLNQVAGACRRAQRPLPVGFSCSVARDVLSALHYAHTFTDPTGHSQSIIHRDVAQKNVMVTYDGVTKLLDFGIAKAKGKIGRTNVGMVKGTTGYMSPEQVRGEEIDGRSDVFSAGVMLHEMLTGRRLFSAETELEEMQLILEKKVPRIEDVNPLLSEELGNVVSKALERERAQRWSSAREMAKALEKATHKVLFDQEQVAAFMRELFAERMAATRTLLESAGAPDSVLAHAAVTQLKIKGDEDIAFESATPVRPRAEQKEPPKRDTNPDLQPPSHVSAAAQLSTEQEKQGRWGTVLALLLAVMIVAGGYGVYRFVFSLPPAPEDLVAQNLSANTPLPAWNDPRVKPFPEPGQAQPPQMQPETVEEEVEVEPLREPKRRKAAEGALTLVTNPESTVLRGKKVVGKTPLFNQAMPAGTHLLRLKGPDGRVHVLSAPIKAGETTAFRLKLADLPLE